VREQVQVRGREQDQVRAGCGSRTRCGPGAGPGSPTGSGDAFADQAGGAFLNLIAQATSGDALEAQNIILRRIALDGDVVPSRVQAQQNISQIGASINLLTNLNETAMRS
jgi:hypothetical protein